ncbi:MAG: hypothetical protein IJ870_05145 [Alphaproteobacteria bacterium]|nr:hypothetical protein [Alphaproteobacteria bacterium]
MAEKETEMNLDYAIRILQGDFAHPLYVEAKEWVLAHDPHNPVLKEVEKREKLFAQQYRLLEENVDVIYDNQKDLQLLSNSYYPNKRGPQKKYMNAVMDRVEIWETDEKTGEKVLVEDKQKVTDYLDLLFDVAKKETEEELLPSQNFHDAKPEDKKVIHNGMTDDGFMSKLLQVSMASDVRQPQGKELEVGTKEHSSWMREQAQKFRQKLADALKTNETIKVDADPLLIATADEADRLQALSTQMRERAKEFEGDNGKKMNAVAERVSKRKDDMERKARELAPNRYRKIKAVARVIKDKASDEIWRYGTTIATSLGFSAAIGSAFAAGTTMFPIAMGFGVLYAAQSYVLPIVAEKRKMKRLAKEAGKEPLKGKAAWKQAFDNLHVKQDGKKLSDFQVQSIVNAGIGLIGGAALGLALDKLQAMYIAAKAGKEGLEAAKAAADAAEAGEKVLKTAKTGAVAIRAGAPAAAMLTDAGVTYVSNPHDPTNRFRAQQKAFNGGIALLIGGASVALSGFGSELLGHGKEAAVSHSAHSTGSFDYKGEVPELMDYDKYTSTATSRPEGYGVLDPSRVIEETPQPVSTSVPLEHFPVKYNASIAGNLEKWRWDLAMSRINNGLISDIDANGLDKVWANMDEQFMSHLPEGRTKMEAFYDYIELMRNGRRHVDILGSEKTTFEDMYGKEQVGFYYKTPAGKVKIEDEGIIAYAKEMIAKDRIPEMARPHGENFLVSQLKELNIEGMDSEKMQAVVAIAMETYDKPQVMGSVAKIHEMFPDMSQDQLRKVSIIVDYNRAYNENGEAMEALRRAYECHDQSGLNKETMGLLEKRHEILSKSHGDARADSIEESGCKSNTMLSSRPRAHQPVENTPAEVPTKATIEKVPAGPQGELRYTSTDTIKAPKLRGQLWGRVIQGQHEGDLLNNVEGEKVITNEQAEAYISAQQKLQVQR